MQGFRAMTSRQVIRWWETRRLALNLILLALAIATYFAVQGVIGSIIPPHGNLEPFVLFAGALGYLAVVNVVHTFGWIVELRERQRHPQRARLHAIRLFKEGLIFGSIATTLPFWIACAIRLLYHFR